MTFVLTSRTDLPVVAGADIEFISGPVADYIDSIRSAAGSGDIHVVGGGALAAELAQSGHRDEIHLSITPVTLGAGAPLFPTHFDSTRLKPKHLHQTGQFIKARYDVIPR